MADDIATGTVFGPGVAPGTAPPQQQDAPTTGTVFGPGVAPMQPSPSPWDPLATTAPTTADYARHYGGLVARALMETNPIDLGANLADTAASAVSRDFNPAWTPPGRLAANAMNLPTPQTPGEEALSGAVAVPFGALQSGGVGGLLEGGVSGAGRGLSTAVRQAPVYAGIGAAQGFLGHDMPPWAQVGIGLGLGAGAGEVVPGMRSAASSEALDLRNAARDRDINIPTAAVGPGGARFVYSATGVPPSGSAGSANRSFVQWADSGAKDIGASATENGRFTPKVLQEATTRIDGLYSAVRRNAPAVPASTGSDFDNGIMALDHNMTTNATMPQPRVQNLMYNLMDAANRSGGNLPGDAAVRALQGGSELDNLVRSSDPEERGFARQLKTVLQDATTKVMPADTLKTWNQANTFYKNLQTYKDARIDSNGTVTPQSLDAAAMAHEDYLGAGGGAPGLNARIGTKFQLSPPTESAGWSGLTWRDIMHGAGPVGGLGAMEYLHGGFDPMTLAKGAGAGYAAALLTNPAMRLMSGGPNPPGALGYYSRLLANPGLYTRPVQLPSQ